MPRPRLLLLHGALGAADQMAPLVTLLQPHFATVSLSLPGHGDAADRGPFRIPTFTGALVEWLDAEQSGPVDCFGYSMGGYVALDTARTRPDLVRSVATLGTKFAWTLETARRETRFLDPEAIRARVPYFADQLERRHAALGWEEVLRRTGDLLAALGEAPVLGEAEFASVPQRVRIMVGDRDRTVTLEESAAAARALPAGELEVLPATPHPFEQVTLPRLVASLRDFFLAPATGSPTET